MAESRGCGGPVPATDIGDSDSEGCRKACRVRGWERLWRPERRSAQTERQRRIGCIQASDGVVTSIAEPARGMPVAVAGEQRRGDEEGRATVAQAADAGNVGRHAFVKGIHGTRYQVKDVARAVAFYTRHLGFTLEHEQLPAFASGSLGDAQILLSGPGASGSRPMPSGQPQEPGGWNRVVLKVADLPGFIAD